MEEELLKLEDEFARAVASNDVDALDEILAEDWIIVGLYGNIALVTRLTTTKGKFMGQDFASCERATDIFVKQTSRWQCVFTQLTRFTKKRSEEHTSELQSPVHL